MKIDKILLVVIVMTVMTSCATKSHVKESDNYDSEFAEESYYRFNPRGYSLYYSYDYGYYYYDPHRSARCLFDTFIYNLYPNLKGYRERNCHWDYFGYRENNCFDRIDHNKNFVQRYDRYGRQQDYTPRNSAGYGHQNSKPRMDQRSNSTKNYKQGSAPRQNQRNNSAKGYSKGSAPQQMQRSRSTNSSNQGSAVRQERRVNSGSNTGTYNRNSSSRPTNATQGRNSGTNRAPSNQRGDQSTPRNQGNNSRSSRR